MQVNFNINILNQLVEQQPDKVDGITNKFPKFNEWKEDIKKPTFNQLSGLANYFNIPFGYFFLDKIPVKKYPIPHYRSLNGRAFNPSSELLDTIETLQQRQGWAKDILAEYKSPLTFANSLSIKTKIEEAAQKIRDVLKLQINWTMVEDLANWKDAFRLLINRAEEAGIFVVVNGVVDNNPTRKLNIKEFRGFVLYDNYAPFIFINGTDFISGRIFTLIHEIVHILIGKSASFDFENLVPAHNEIEEFCDAVTAEFLVPKVIILKEFERVGSNYDALARTFKVSRIVIARRLLDFNKITKSEFIRAYNSFRINDSEITVSKEPGGNFYNTSPYRISREFFNLVYNSVKQNKILYRDAFKLTGLKPSSFDGYIKEHFTHH